MWNISKYNFQKPKTMTLMQIYSEPMWKIRLTY